MQPVVHPLVHSMINTTLSLFVLMMRKQQIHTTRMNVNIRSQNITKNIRVILVPGKGERKYLFKEILSLLYATEDACNLDRTSYSWMVILQHSYLQDLLYTAYYERERAMQLNSQSQHALCNIHFFLLLKLSHQTQTCDFTDNDSYGKTHDYTFLFIQFRAKSFQL
jgi:hypothetical protein